MSMQRQSTKLLSLRVPLKESTEIQNFYLSARKYIQTVFQSETTLQIPRSY